MYLAHYTKRFIPEFDAECRLQTCLNPLAKKVTRYCSLLKLLFKKMALHYLLCGCAKQNGKYSRVTLFITKCRKRKSQFLQR